MSTFLRGKFIRYDQEFGRFDLSAATVMKELRALARRRPRGVQIKQYWAGKEMTRLLRAFQTKDILRVPSSVPLTKREAAEEHRDWQGTLQSLGLPQLLLRNITLKSKLHPLGPTLKSLIERNEFSKVRCKRCKADYLPEQIRRRKWSWRGGPRAMRAGRLWLCPDGHEIYRSVERMA